MSFSVNTNITSLQAQEYLRQTSDFQAKTLNRVTSGLRIVSSGDDAAGLAIANSLRSDEAVLSQGVRNANDGLSQLQTIDGGMSNISKLLDRARTLATQSATGTFTGDRSVLNNEFQNVMGEINRQSQAVGMNKGGTFAKNLSVFVGGGRGTTDAATIKNGSVTVDLRSSTVDAKSLGLDTYKAQSSGTYNLGVASDTSVSKIVNSPAGQSDGAAGGAVFVFRGAGFADTPSGNGAQGISITVATTGLTDTAGLAAAINQKIYDKANPGSGNETDASKAFKAAGVTATIVTDSSGNEELAFTSSSAAFQVNGGNRTANAFLGNFADTRAGSVAGEGSTKITSDNAIPALTSANTGTTATIRFTTGTTAGSTITLTTALDTAGASAQSIVDKINTDIQNGGTAADQKIHAELKDGKLSFTQQDGAEFTFVVDSNGTATSLGFTSQAGVAAKTSAFTATNSGGVYQSSQEVSAQGQTDHSTDAYKFTAVSAGSQTLTVNAKRADGSSTGIDIKLDTTSGADVNTAVNYVNDQLQASKDPSLMNIVAVRDGAGIKFMGTEGFSVKLGASVDGAGTPRASGFQGLSETRDGNDKQAGVQLDATSQGESGLADISNQASAEKAVSMLANAVSTLGQAQAVVGRGQNQFSYAVNLAQSQLSNQAAAESRIRDADLANEAANMTKAQVLLQAGVAAMAQANSAPQQILSLLRG